MFLVTRKRLAWLATCAMLVACASAPDPKPSKRKKKKKKKDSIALKSKKDRDNDDEDKPRKKKDAEDEDKPRKKKDAEDEDSSRKKKTDAADDDKPKADDEVKISDDNSDDESSRAKKKKDDKKKKKEEPVEEPAEEVASKKKKKKEEPVEEPVEEVASKKKKKKKEEPVEEPVEEVASKKKKDKEENGDGEEVAAKPKKKKEETKVAAKDKKKKAEPEAAPEIEMDDPPDEAEPTKVAAKSKKKDTKKKTADVDMTAPPEDENVIEMGEEPERVEDAPPDRSGVAIAVPGTESDEETSSSEEDKTPIGSNPLSINERPLVLAKSKLGVHGGIGVNVLTLETMPGMKTSTTKETFALGVNYGVGDSSEVGLDYTLGLNPSSAKGPLTIHGAYAASSSAKLDIAIAAALALDFTGSTDPTTMQTTSKTLISLQLGAWARYRINRKLSAFTGVPATPNSAVGLQKLSFPLPPLPYQLVIGVNNAGTIALDIPAGVGYQASPKLYVFGVLDLAHIRVANTENAFIFSDFIPLVLGGFYSLDKLDLGVQFADDLKQGTDYLRFDTVVRYMIK